mmetsp:Transcript_2640/g.7942  ORF Transcript_2640/g.7942 Transcript_2640/m.7942 type:complete len:210 (+) Transcript_2640:442-1071(+)
MMKYWSGGQALGWSHCWPESTRDVRTPPRWTKGSSFAKTCACAASSRSSPPPAHSMTKSLAYVLPGRPPRSVQQPSRHSRASIAFRRAAPARLNRLDDDDDDDDSRASEEKEGSSRRSSVFCCCCARRQHVPAAPSWPRRESRKSWRRARLASKRSMIAFRSTGTMRSVAVLLRSSSVIHRDEKSQPDSAAAARLAWTPPSAAVARSSR